MKGESMNADPCISAFLEKIREKRPLIHHITNQVTMNDCANAAYAVGARPTMAFYAPEAVQASGQADAVVWNLGTFHPEMAGAIRALLPAASRRPIPVVIDPVAAQAYSGRREFTMEILDMLENVYRSGELRCRIILRCNAAELRSLSIAHGSPSGGVDALGGVDAIPMRDDPKETILGFLRLYRKRLPVLAVMTGAADWIGWSCPAPDVPGPGGEPSWETGAEMFGEPFGDIGLLCSTESCRLLTHITGAGCISNTLIAAFASAVPETAWPWDSGDEKARDSLESRAEQAKLMEQTAQAALAALRFLVLAASAAEKECRGLGSFRMHLMDEIGAHITGSKDSGNRR